MISNPGKIIAIVFFAVISAGAIFFGLQHLSAWHEQEIQSALELQRKQFESRYRQLEMELAVLESELEKQKQETALPEDRILEVFGGPEIHADEADGRVLEKRVDSFFAYIDKKTITGGNNSRDVFFKMISDLAEKPPLVVGETRDLITLLRNRAHFFRVLSRERINMVRAILDTEKDILESAMSDIHSCYIEGACNAENPEKMIPLPAMYDYAGFFLETISGKSYLMRRDSVLRSLSLYYSVLVLDQAIENGLNKYGIDIRGHIDLAISDIRHQGGLAQRDHYLDTLENLKHKYQIRE